MNSTIVLPLCGHTERAPGCGECDDFYADTAAAALYRAHLGRLKDPTAKVPGPQCGDTRPHAPAVAPGSPALGDDRPGGHLKFLLGSVGVPACRQCIQDAAWMDGLGAAGCRERFEEIVTRLEPRAKSLGWFTWAKAGTLAAAKGLPLTVRGMVEKALSDATPRGIG